MAAQDRFPGAEDLLGPACHAAAITPSSSNQLPFVTKRIWVGGTGNVTLVTVGGETVTYTGVPAGAYLNVRAVQVTAATATNLIAEY